MVQFLARGSMVLSDTMVWFGHHGLFLDLMGWTQPVLLAERPGGHDTEDKPTLHPAGMSSRSGVRGAVAVGRPCRRPDSDQAW